MKLELGILLMERRDPSQGVILHSWLDDQVMPAFAGRILAIDTAATQCCAALHVPDPRSDPDALIAASALTHKMTVVTRNLSDFANIGVPLINPWEDDSAPKRS